MFVSVQLYTYGFLRITTCNMMWYGVETDFAKLFVECMLKECDLLKSELFFRKQIYSKPTKGKYYYFSCRLKLPSFVISCLLSIKDKKVKFLNLFTQRAWRRPEKRADFHFGWMILVTPSVAILQHCWYCFHDSTDEAIILMI